MISLRAWAIAQHSAVYEWTFAVLAIVLSVLIRYQLDDALPAGFPFLTFFPAVILTSFFASTRAGVVAGIGCGLAAWYFFLEPGFTFRLTGPSVLALCFYAFITTTNLLLIHVMRQSMTRLEAERDRSDGLAQANKLMFHELQHRVSNNLQVVSSILKMQQRNVTDDAARQALETASARLRVVSSVQRQLHNPKRQSTDMGSLLRDVLPEVIRTSSLDDNVTLEFDMAPLVVSGDQATPLALIVVELVSNSLEHATRADAKTVIRIETRTKDGMAEVIVQDNGKGLPSDFAPERSRSLGLRIAHQFTEQLGGTLSFDSVEGTRAVLAFPLQEMHPV